MEENPYLKYFENGCTDQAVDDAINAALNKVNKIIEIRFMISKIMNLQFVINETFMEGYELIPRAHSDREIALGLALRHFWKDDKIEIINPYKPFVPPLI